MSPEDWEKIQTSRAERHGFIVAKVDDANYPIRLKDQDGNRVQGLRDFNDLAVWLDEFESPNDIDSAE